MIAPPIAHLESIDLDLANRLLLDWGHQMGPIVRSVGGVWPVALMHHGRPVAVTVAADLIRETCAGKSRQEAVELARLCAARRDICRPMLRLWRLFVLPELARAHGYSWAVSYQDAALHTGDVYRFDGWTRLARSRSGTDPRTGRVGRDKWIWGWPLSEEAAA